MSKLKSDPCPDCSESEIVNCCQCGVVMCPHCADPTVTNCRHCPVGPLGSGNYGAWTCEDCQCGSGCCGRCGEPIDGDGEE